MNNVWVCMEHINVHNEVGWACMGYMYIYRIHNDGECKGRVLPIANLFKLVNDDSMGISRS